MTLNFPDSPSTGDIYTDSTSGFQYEWNGTVWISTDPQRAANIKELDDISSGFNGSTTQFNLTVSSSAVEPVSDAQLLISVGGVMQNPTNDYTVSGSTITFTTAPSAGLTFFGVFLGQALSLNTIQDGTVEFASFKTGTAGVGIKSDGTAIGVGITQIDFVGSGNTVVSVGNTVSVYIAAGIDTTGISRFATGVTTNATNTNLTVTGITTLSDDVTFKGAAADVTWDKSTDDLIWQDNAQAKFGTGGDLSIYHNATHSYLDNSTGQINIRSDGGIYLRNTGGSESYAKFINNGAAELYFNNTKRVETTSVGINVVGNVDCDSFNNAGISTFGGELTAASATVSDLTDNRVVIAGTSGALEDSSNLTFDGSTLTVNGDMNVQGELTYQEVSEIDSVGFVTARKGVRVTNGGIIVTAGLSTFSDDIKLAGANYNITFDRSADDVIFDDNAKAIFGTSSDGLEIYHDSSDSYITNTGTGNLIIKGDDVHIQGSNGENMINCNEDGSVDLRYNNVKTFATESNGIVVYGPEAGSADIYMYADEGDDTADKWRIQVDTSGNLRIGNRSTGSWVNSFSVNGAGHIGILADPLAGSALRVDGNLYFNGGDEIHGGSSGSNLTILGGSTYPGGRIVMGGGAGDDNIVFTTSGASATNTERMRLDSNGRLIIGHTTSTGEDRILQIVGTSADTSAAQIIRHSADSSSPQIDLTKSRNATKGSNTILQSGDTLGQITFRGDDGTDLNSTGATIVASVDGTPGSNDMPGRLVFSTTADGSASETERMRITSAGKIGINEDDPDGDLQVTTTASANGELKVGGSGSTGNGMKITYSNSSNTSTIFKQNYHATNAGALMQFDSGYFTFRTGTSPTTSLTLDASQNATFAGTVSDSKGNLRSIPENARGTTYTLVATDAGKCVTQTHSSGFTIDNSVFSAGDAVTMINGTGSDFTITQGSGLTLYNSADASTGNRTLASRGMATVWFQSASVGYISGAGLS